jgi:hypothetical protein
MSTVQQYGAGNNVVVPQGGFLIRTFTDNITASTTHTAAGGVALVSDLNTVLTASANDAVTLPVSVPGMDIEVSNYSANTIQIWPNAAGTKTEQINALGANISFSLAAGKTAEFYCTASGQWYSTLTA